MEAVRFAGEMQRRAAHAAHMVVGERGTPIAAIEAAADGIPRPQAVPARFQLLHRREAMAGRMAALARGEIVQFPIGFVQPVVQRRVETRAGFKNQHAHPLRGQRPGRRGATRAGADDHDVVGLVRLHARRCGGSV